MGYISSLILLSAFKLGIYFCLEQPISSLLFKFGPMKAALRETKASSFHFEIASFCGESPKPLRAFGTASFLKVFIEVAQRRRKPRTTVGKRLTTRSSGGGYTGRVVELKRSSAYTHCMGVAAALAVKGLTADKIIGALIANGF